MSGYCASFAGMRRSACTVSANKLAINHLLHNVVRNLFNFLNFVRGSKTVEKRKDRNAGF